MNTEEAKRLLDDLYNNGCKRISFAGGEPLLRTDIEELINYCKHKGFICTVNTNGLLVPSKIRELKNLNSICLILDGRREHNDIIRGTGSYDAVIRD